MKNSDVLIVSAYANVFIYLFSGPCKIDVTYENLPIPQSPFGVNVSPGNDPSRVKAYGPGLERGFTNQPQTFTIETKGAGQGSLSLAVEGKDILYFPNM